MIPILRSACIALLLLASVGGATAQNRAAGGERKGATPGDFDFYVLALSWSPGFCALRDADDRPKEQCAPGKRLGFVVHGLWPQYEEGYPTQCGITTRGPSRAALEIAATIYPEEHLAAHQWRRHGSCSGKAPTEYFTAVKTARDKVAVPARLAAGDATLGMGPRDVERAFIEANPGLRLEALSVTCRSETLQEVRICLTKDLREFRACPEVDRRSCRASRIKVPGVAGD